MDSTCWERWQGGVAPEISSGTDSACVHCGERSRSLLTGLGLDQIFDIHANGSAAPQCELLQRDKANGAAEEKKQVNADMLDAHEALCEAVPQNFSRFKDVLDYLKQDLHHETPSN